MIDFQTGVIRLSEEDVRYAESVAQWRYEKNREENMPHAYGAEQTAGGPVRNDVMGALGELAFSSATADPLAVSVRQDRHRRWSVRGALQI